MVSRYSCSELFNHNFNLNFKLISRISVKLCFDNLTSFYLSKDYPFLNYNRYTVKGVKSYSTE